MESVDGEAAGSHGAGVRVRHAAQIAGFAALAAAVIALLSALFVPTWTGWGNDATVRGFYEQPRDSVEVVFLGTSNAKCGFSPDQLYSEWGACSYNLATEGQPLMASYYWVQEAMRLQGGSLKTVLLDPSALFSGEGASKNLGYAEIALANMQPSPVKIEALRECEERYEEFSAFEAFVAVLGFHSRWTSLESADFEALAGEPEGAFARGQYVLLSLLANFSEPAGSGWNEGALGGINWSGEAADDKTMPNDWQQYNYEMLYKIIEYCRDSGLNFAFAQLPRQTADVAQSQEIARVAREFDVPFLDLNTQAWRIRNEFNPLTDIAHYNHLNLYGSRKAMSAVGEFLESEFGLEDVRGKAGYSFMGESLAAYEQAVRDSELQTCAELNEYLERILDERYITLVAAMDDAGSGLTPEVRERCLAMGLADLAGLGYRESYIGVLDGQSVYLDWREADTSLGCRSNFGFRKGDHILPAASENSAGSVPGQIIVASAGLEAGNRSFIVFDGVDYSEHGRGLNFVVIDRMTGDVLDTSCFDTHAGTSRTSDRFETSMRAPFKAVPILALDIIESAAKTAENALLQTLY